jgi:hypothetical protein
MASKARRTAAMPRAVADGMITMIHPSGGRCDAYRSDRSGFHRVPAADVPGMIAHGFVQKEG